MPSAPTVVTLSDVIEHIQDVRGLFGEVRKISCGSTKLLLTFPSEFYQRYLKAEAPHELQIVDNLIRIDQLHADAESAGFTITSFKLIDVWRRVQYAHCVLEDSKDLATRVKDASVMSSSRTIYGRVVEYVDRHVFEGRRRKRYVDDVFSNRQSE
jgi:hypothetical protein